MEISVRVSVQLDEDEQFTAQGRNSKFRVTNLATTKNFPNRLMADGPRLNKDGTVSARKGREIEFIEIKDIPQPLQQALIKAGVMRAAAGHEAAKQAALG